MLLACLLVSRLRLCRSPDLTFLERTIIKCAKTEGGHWPAVRAWRSLKLVVPLIVRIVGPITTFRDIERMKGADYVKLGQ